MIDYYKNDFKKAWTDLRLPRYMDLAFIQRRFGLSKKLTKMIGLEFF